MRLEGCTMKQNCQRCNGSEIPVLPEAVAYERHRYTWMSQAL